MLKPVALLALVFSFATTFAHAAKCPVINGTFAMEKDMEDGSRKRFTLLLHTRIDRAMFSYTIDREGNFQAADGQSRPVVFGGRHGYLRFSCLDGALKQETWAVDDKDGNSLVVKTIKLLPTGDLEIVSSLSKQSGVYAKPE